MIVDKNFKAYRLYFGKYVCRKWNRFEKHKDQLNLELFYMKERTPWATEPVKICLGRVRFFEKDARANLSARFFCRFSRNVRVKQVFSHAATCLH